jgi:hypothetical protein
VCSLVFPLLWFREGGGTTSLAWEGVRESQFRRGDRHRGTLGIHALYDVYVLCATHLPAVAGPSFECATSDAATKLKLGAAVALAADTAAAVGGPLLVAADTAAAGGGPLPMVADTAAAVGDPLPMAADTAAVVGGPLPVAAVECRQTGSRCP